MHCVQSRALQVRDVPETLHKRLRLQAAAMGTSLSDYVLKQLEKIAARPTPSEMAERLSRRPPIDYGEAVAEAIAEERAKR